MTMITTVYVPVRKIDIPARWRPVPAELRDTTPAPCDRCDTIVRLPFGPGAALCPACKLAQTTDLYAAVSRR